MPSQHLRIAAFCMPLRGHLNSLLCLTRELVSVRCQVDIFSHPSCREEILRSGATFHDLRLEEPADGDAKPSWPPSMRAVDHAARQGEALISAVRQIAPAVILYDAFCVVAQVVSHRLNLPRIRLAPGHYVDPQILVSNLKRQGLIYISQATRLASTELRERFGIEDAQPFMFLTEISPWLNIYGDIPELCAPPGLAGCANVAFFGPNFQSLDEWRMSQRTPGPSLRSGLTVYASFGTVVWRHFRRQIVESLSALAAAFGRRAEGALIISLGGSTLGEDEVGRICRSRVSVRAYVDQRRVLSTCDFFVTHNGLNSTHESIASGVPMLSHPFFFDQPRLAERCQALGMALPLGCAEQVLTVADVEGALELVIAERRLMEERIRRAQIWQEKAIKNRHRVVARILGVASMSC